MRSCRTVSELTALNKLRPLTLVEKISVTIHRAICAPCRAYKKQMNRLQSELANMSEDNLRQDTALESDARHRILEKIKSQANDN